MLNLTYEITLPNIINLLFGIVFGFFIMIMLTSAIMSLVVKKNNKNIKIREISNRAFNDFYNKNQKMKDKIISSMIYEVKEVSSLVNEESKYSLYELSINDIINGLDLIQKKLKRLITHPLFKDIKNIRITTLLSIEEKVARPVVTISKNKVVKLLMYVFKFIMTILNFINPIFYIKKIIKFALFKKGKQDLIIICLDFIGNTTYEIYNSKDNLQN